MLRFKKYWKEYEGVHDRRSTCLLPSSRISCGSNQIVWEEIIVLNLDLAKPSEVLFLKMNRMNGTGSGLVIYFKDFSLA